MTLIFSDLNISTLTNRKKIKDVVRNPFTKPQSKLKKYHKGNEDDKIFNIFQDRAGSR